MAKLRSEAPLDGWIVVDKPGSWTSHDVVGWLRRLLGERQIGHAGTLDPAATGVLPIGVGYATRLMEYLSGKDKGYVAEIEFGTETDSLDGDGRVVATRDFAHLRASDVRTALDRWRGLRLQQPPMHSAIKIGGRRLYEHARQGRDVPRPDRPVIFHTLELLSWDAPVAEVYVECSKGTYIRSLARDLGWDLGAGAYLANLVRTQTGPFCLGDAWTLAELGEYWESQGPTVWPQIAFHPDHVISSWPVLLLDDQAERRWQSGQTLRDSASGEAHCRAFGASGEWLGIGRALPAGDGWRPTKVAGGTA